VLQESRLPANTIDRSSHADRLIGRVDPELDRGQRVVRVHSLHLEPEAPEGAKAPIEGALHELADWLGAGEVALA